MEHFPVIFQTIKKDVSMIILGGELFLMKLIISKVELYKLHEQHLI